jgi:hypothetical protein
MYATYHLRKALSHKILASVLRTLYFILGLEAEEQRLSTLNNDQYGTGLKMFGFLIFGNFHNISSFLFS